MLSAGNAVAGGTHGAGRRRWLLPVVLAALAVPVATGAQTLTVSWDPNRETDIAGYLVAMREVPSGVTRRVDVGLRTTWPTPPLAAGGLYCFAVQAYNTSGLSSAPSAEVCAMAGVAQAALPATLPDWLAHYGLAANAGDGDADGDGLGNAAEFAAGTNPLVPNVAYLTEGATGVFAERLAIVNPDVVPAEVDLRFLLDSDVPRQESIWLAARSRVTVDVNRLLGGGGIASSVVMTVRRGGAVIERTMSWSGRAGHLAAHTAKASPAPRRDWWLAEGTASWFDTWLLVANPHPWAVSLDIDFLVDDGRVVSRRYTAGAESRFSLLANSVSELAGRAFAARVRAGSEVTVERAMYFGLDGALWKGGHVSPAIQAPARAWFVAEGRTGPFFDTWLLIGNPGTTAATVTLRYLTPAGEARREVRQVAASSRLTIHLDELPGLQDTEVSVALDSTVPIVVERSMYWPGEPRSWYEGHNSTGLTRLGTLWVLAEGEVGGPRRAETYILVANPGRSPVDVTLRALREGGAPLVAWRSLGAGQRLTVSAAEFGLADGERVGFVVESSAPVAVERSMYWSTPQRFWSAGTNETGTLLR